MELAIRLLGDVTIQRADSSDPPATLHGAKARLAFAMLALERDRGVGRDSLADALWPEGLPPTWASALRTVISRVRRFVGGALGDGHGDHDDLVVAHGGTYLLRLPEHTTVDLELAAAQVAAAQTALGRRETREAHQLARAATERLRADFLTDNDGEWATAQRARLAELLMVGLETLCQAAAARGDSPTAMTAALEAVDRSPLRESAHRCLMAAHAVAGDRARALQSYQRLRRLLAEELGLDPEAATEQAYLELLGPAPPAPSRSQGPATALHRGVATPFVGRHTELGTLTEAWHQVVGGARQLLLVSGEAGIGKTRLATHFARTVSAEGTRVLLGRCDVEAVIRYQPFVEMFDGLLATMPHDELPQLLAPARAELAAVFPSLAGPPDGPGAGNRAVLFDALTKLVAAVAVDRPLLMILDDLQWADADTLLLLRHVLRHMDDRSLLVLALVRGTPPSDTPLGQALRALERDGLVGRLRLGGLDRGACRALVRQVVPDAPDLLATLPRLVADTAGNPFMLIELVEAHTDGAPEAWPQPGQASPALRDLVIDRLSTLDPVAHELLVAAAVAGPDFQLAVAAAASDLDRAASLDAVEAAEAAGLVVEAEADGDPRYQFTHEVLRRTLYSQLSRAQRRLLHERIADALEEQPFGSGPMPMAALAVHRCAGAEPSGDIRAVRWALAAAREAQALGLAAETEQWCHQALEHVAEGDAMLEVEVLTELGLARSRRDDVDGAATLFDAAVRARSSGRMDVAARAALGLADGARVRPELRSDAEALVQDILLGEAPRAGTEAGRLPRVLGARLVARQLELGSAPSGTTTTQVATAAAILCRELDELDGPDRIDERIGLAEEVAVLGRTLGDEQVELVAYHHRAMAATIAGDQAATAAALEAMATVARSGSQATAKRWLADRDVAVAVTEGRFDELQATPGAQDAPDAPAMQDGLLRAELDVATQQRFLAGWLQGRPDDELSRITTPTGHRDLLPGEAVLLQLAQGDRGRVRLALRALADGTEPLPSGDSGLHTLGVMSLAAVDIGDDRVARGLYRLLVPYANLVCGVGYRSFAGTAALHLGRLAAVAREWADAERHLTDALRQLSMLNARPWIGLAQHTLADVLQARGRSSDREWVSALRAEASWLAAHLGLRAFDPPESMVAPDP